MKLTSCICMWSALFHTAIASFVCFVGDFFHRNISYGQRMNKIVNICIDTRMVSKWCANHNTISIPMWFMLGKMICFFWWLTHICHRLSDHHHLVECQLSLISLLVAVSISKFFWIFLFTTKVVKVEIISTLNMFSFYSLLVFNYFRLNGMRTEWKPQTVFMVRLLERMFTWWLYLFTVSIKISLLLTTTIT